MIWAAIACWTLGALGAASSYGSPEDEPQSFAIDTFVGGGIWYAIFLLCWAGYRATTGRRRADR